MQRKVVELLKKYLDKGYDDYQTEIMYESAFGVLMSGGVSQIPLDDWHRAERFQCEDMLVRPLAREIIATIRGVDQADLYTIPDKERLLEILMDMAPDTGDKGFKSFWAECHVDYLLEELTRIRPQTFWRGKRIAREESLE